MNPHLVSLDPALPDPDADHLLDLIRDFGAFPVYVEGPVTEGFGAGLVRRHDALMNYVQQQYAAGPVESMAELAARTNLFRGVLAEGTTVHVPDAEDLLYRHEPFLDAARTLTGLPHVVPDMLYVNFLVPGQELAIHTDTPEYRGLSKHVVPEWFCVVMHHSGLFEDWRVRIAGGVTFLHPPDEGGAFLVYPDGPGGPVKRVGLKHNSSVMLDADALFHGVERVGGAEAPAPPVRPGMTLRSVDADTWELAEAGERIARWGWGEVRLSIQWKAHCFADEAAHVAMRDHTDDLTLEGALDRLEQDMRERGVLTGERPEDTALGLLLIQTYITFPGNSAS